MASSAVSRSPLVYNVRFYNQLQDKLPEADQDRLRRFCSVINQSLSGTFDEDKLSERITKLRLSPEDKTALLEVSLKYTGDNKELSSFLQSKLTPSKQKSCSLGSVLNRVAKIAGIVFVGVALGFVLHSLGGGPVRTCPPGRMTFREYTEKCPEDVVDTFIAFTSFDGQHTIEPTDCVQVSTEELRRNPSLLFGIPCKFKPRNESEPCLGYCRAMKALKPGQVLLRRTVFDRPDNQTLCLPGSYACFSSSRGEEMSLKTKIASIITYALNRSFLPASIKTKIFDTLMSRESFSSEDISRAIATAEARTHR